MSGLTTGVELIIEHMLASADEEQAQRRIKESQQREEIERKMLHRDPTLAAEAAEDEVTDPVTDADGTEDYAPRSLKRRYGARSLDAPTFPEPLRTLRPLWEIERNEE
jgi:hypothetical protein